LGPWDRLEASVPRILAFQRCPWIHPLVWGTVRTAAPCEPNAVTTLTQFLGAADTTPVTLSLYRPLSASTNDLLRGALVQHRLGLLVDQMEAEAGSASPEAYAVVLRGVSKAGPAPGPSLVLDSEGLWAVARNDSEDARAARRGRGPPEFPLWTPR